MAEAAGRRARSHPDVCVEVTRVVTNPINDNRSLANRHAESCKRTGCSVLLQLQGLREGVNYTRFTEALL